MKRVAIFGAAALMLTALAGPVAAKGPEKATGGVGWTGPRGPRHAGFNAQADKGQLEITDFDGSSLHVAVECLKVVNGAAWFGGEITKATGAFDPGRVGEGLVTKVEDNATPGSQGDRIGNRGAGDADDACDDVEAMVAVTMRDVESGNLQVKG